MSTPQPQSDASIEILGGLTPQFNEILTPDALAFVADLARKFSPRRDQLLRRRAQRQSELDAGKPPDFLEETADVRCGDWKVAPPPADLQDRRVEITGPVDRKMIINALNSGASVFMADFEDSHSPTWRATIEGQVNLRDAVANNIEFTSPEGRHYQLNDKISTLLVRPRGWHLNEKHMLVDGKAVAGAFFDFGLFFYHNARKLIDKGAGPYFYLPKMESHLEARLWNDVFNAAQDALNIPRGSIKATVLIETLLAAFEMDEILYELRDHSTGLNCGRWDYIFSFIKNFRRQGDYVTPDRAQVNMTTHFMHCYSQLLIKTCHHRGAHAMGGMAAQIPIKGDSQANAAAIARVRADKEREAGDGHDGTWVAHPGLVSVAKDVFDRHMPTANQLNRLRQEVQVGAADLLQAPTGAITEAGLRNNISVAIQYLESWLGGNGCTPINNLMEDAATAEISRAQIWQWIRYPKGVLDDGRKVTFDLYRALQGEELDKIRNQIGTERYDSGHFARTVELLDKITAEDELADFLTLRAYPHLP